MGRGTLGSAFCIWCKMEAIFEGITPGVVLMGTRDYAEVKRGYRAWFSLQVREGAG